MIRKTFTTLCLSMLFLALWANPVGEDLTRQIAQQAYTAALQRHGKPLADDLQLQLIDQVQAQLPSGLTDLYRVYIHPTMGGFVIVAADDRVLPVLGYDTRSPYAVDPAEQPIAFRKWMEFTRQQIKRTIIE
ncbi:MAG: Spi family protease inhibitor, partial [Lewinella sp.]|nr:Spi family protease inhibitor [Lewinella sp.]